MSLQEAKDPNTPTHRLEALSRADDKEILRALSENPNTPLTMLHKLWERFPGGYMKNPAVPLLQLEDPAFISRLPMSTIASLLLVSEIDEAVLLYACKDHRTPYAPPLSAHPRTPPETLHYLARAYTSDEILRGVARNPRTSQKTLELLLGSNAKIALEALAHPSLAEDLVALRPLLREVLAGGGSLASLSLRELSVVARCGFSLRKKVAENPLTTSELLVAMTFGSLSPKMRELSPATLSLRSPILSVAETGASWEYESLQAVVARHPNAPEKLLLWFYEQKKDQLNNALAANPSTPREILEKLSRKNAEPVKLALASNPKLPEDLVEKLLFDADTRVVAAALLHPSMTDAQLDRMLTTASINKLRSLVNRNDTPSRVLDRILDRDVRALRPLLVKNENLPQDLLSLIERAEKREPLTKEEVERLSLRSGYLRELLLLHPQAPPALVIKAARSLPTRLRIQLAKQSREQEVLTLLIEDQDPNVRERAIERSRELMKE